MGDQVSDAIAEKFAADGRFDLVSRDDVHAEMQRVWKDKSMKVEKYLTMATEQAAEHKADCLVFGKISKKGNQITFLVRMADVETGENRVKRDDDMDRSEAGAYFENLGTSLVSYFVTAPQPVAQPVPVAYEPPPRGDSTRFTLVGWGGQSFISVDATTQKVFDTLKSISGSTSAQGGVGGGAEGWLRVGSNFELGVGIAYLPLFQYKYAETIGSITTTFDFNVNYLPFMAQMRFISRIGIYLGVGAGFYIGASDLTLTQRNNTTGLTVTAKGTGSGSALGFNALLGWQIPLGDTLGLDIGAKGWYITADGSGVAASFHGGIALRF